MDHDHLLVIGRVAERFGVRPSSLLRGDLEDLLFDVKVLETVAKEDQKIMRKVNRRGRV